MAPAALSPHRPHRSYASRACERKGDFPDKAIRGFPARKLKIYQYPLPIGGDTRGGSERSAMLCSTIHLAS